MGRANHVLRVTLAALLHCIRAVDALHVHFVFFFYLDIFELHLPPATHCNCHDEAGQNTMHLFLPLYDTDGFVRDTFRRGHLLLH